MSRVAREWGLGGPLARPRQVVRAVALAGLQAAAAQPAAALGAAQVLLLAGLEHGAVVLVPVDLPRRAVAPAVAPDLAAHRARGDADLPRDQGKGLVRVEARPDDSPHARIQVGELLLLFFHAYLLIQGARSYALNYRMVLPPNCNGISVLTALLQSILH